MSTHLPTSSPSYMTLQLHLVAEVYMQAGSTIMNFVQTTGCQAYNQTRQPGVLANDNAVLRMQAMEYMVNCKYKEAAEKSGHPVECHCVILVSLQTLQHINSCVLPSLCWQTPSCLQLTVSCSMCQKFVWAQCRQAAGVDALALHRQSSHTVCIL